MGDTPARRSSSKQLRTPGLTTTQDLDNQRSASAQGSGVLSLQPTRFAGKQAREQPGTVSNCERTNKLPEGSQGLHELCDEAWGLGFT